MELIYDLDINDINIRAIFTPIIYIFGSDLLMTPPSSKILVRFFWNSHFLSERWMDIVQRRNILLST